MSEDRESNDVDGASSAGAPDAETPSPRTCPHCDEPIVAVTTRGPTDHVAAPCGCRVAPPDR